MSDLAITGTILVLLVGLAIAAPIWGVDSRDGPESDQASRRADWLHERPFRQTGRVSNSLARSRVEPLT